jgi:hypothetical protein
VRFFFGGAFLLVLESFLTPELVLFSPIPIPCDGRDRVVTILKCRTKISVDGVC